MSATVTDTNKARWTMGVIYLPQFKKAKYANQQKEGFDFVFRCDNVAREYATGQKYFDNPKDALLEKFWDIVNRCAEMQVFDNAMPKGKNRLLYVVNGIVEERLDKRGNVIRERLQPDTVRRKLKPL